MGGGGKCAGEEMRPSSPPPSWYLRGYVECLEGVVSPPPHPALPRAFSPRGLTSTAHRVWFLGTPASSASARTLEMTLKIPKESGTVLCVRVWKGSNCCLFRSGDRLNDTCHSPAAALQARLGWQRHAPVPHSLPPPPAQDFHRSSDRQPR